MAWTWADLIDALNSRCQAQALAVDVPALARFTAEAYRLVRAHDWRSLMVYDALDLQAGVSMTADYDGAGTLTATANWPSWAADNGGQLVQMPDGRLGRVESVSGTTLKLRKPYSATSFTAQTVRLGYVRVNPTYSIRRVRKAWYEQTVLDEATPAVVHDMLRLTQLLGYPNYYTLEEVDGRRMVGIYPAPTSGVHPLVLDYIRDVGDPQATGFAPDDTQGTVSVVSGSATVSGTGTAFGAKHVGCVLRVSSDSKAPGGRFSSAAGTEVGVVKSVGSATSLTLESAAGVSVSGVGYRLSTRLDLPDHAIAYLEEQSWWELVSVWKPELASLVERRLSQARLAALAADSFGGPRGSPGRVSPIVVRPIIIGPGE